MNKRRDIQAVIDFYLAIAGMRHAGVKEHSIRVAALAARSAVNLGYDARAAYVSGILHDIGKIALPCQLFDGHNISAEEYSEVKGHVHMGYEALRDKFLFTALVAGFHHSLGKAGYGLTVKDLPENLSVETAKKVLNIAELIAVCDYVDAASTRTTAVKDGSGAETLREALLSKYPNAGLVIDVVLGTHSR